MSDAPPIRVIRPDDVVWGESPSQPQETDPPGGDCTAAGSPDGKFSVGYWERDTQSRPIVRPYHEVAYILDGKNATVWADEAPQLEQAGATAWVEETVVIDGNIVTSNSPDASQEFSAAVVKVLQAGN